MTDPWCCYIYIYGVPWIPSIYPIHVSIYQHHGSVMGIDVPYCSYSSTSNSSSSFLGCQGSVSDCSFTDINGHHSPFTSSRCHWLQVNLDIATETQGGIQLVSRHHTKASIQIHHLPLLPRRVQCILEG